MTDKPSSETGQTNPEVTSLAGFMDWVQEQQKSATKKPGEAKEFFYRGHADERYQLQPSAFRKNEEGKSYREVEYHLYQEMLRRNTEIFAEDKTTFERLVRMQHYGLPTRLLDVTQSALIALFFACGGGASKNVNGEVILFVHPQSDVLHSPAILEGTVAGLDSLLQLCNMNMSIKQSFEDTCSKYSKTIIPSPPYTDLLIKNYNSILKKCDEIDNKTDFWEVILIVKDIEKDINNLPMREEQFSKEFPEVDQKVLGVYINLLMGNLIKLRDDTLAEF